MTKEIGRNDPCWCGSGKKYKHCHINRDKENPTRLSEVTAELRRAFSKKYCLVCKERQNECNGQIVRAHTIPKSSSLKRIAENGHVIGFESSLQAPPNTSKPKPKLIGINRASTFSGFCGFHDNIIFSPLEDENFSGTSEQCVLLSYRAFAREFFLKTASSSLSDFENGLDRGKSVEQQHHIQNMLKGFGVGVDVALRDLGVYKDIYDSRLREKRYSGVRFVRVVLQEAPPIMVSGALLPESDFKGRQLQDLNDLHRRADSIDVTSFFGGEHGEVVLTWLPECDGACKPFAESLLEIPKNRLTDTLIRFFFDSFENLYVAPHWWDALSSGQQGALVERLNKGVDFGAKSTTNYLTERTVAFEAWNVIRVINFTGSE